MNVLLVEDERLISLVLSRIISTLGHSVVLCAASAEKALEFLAGNRVDFVLLDIRLEGEMDGIEAASVIRERWRIPLAFASAYADADTRRRAAAAEPVAMLSKPVRKEDLARILAEIRPY